MENEFTIKDLYEIIDKRFSGLEAKVEKYHDAFVHFEEGKVSDLIQRVTILESQNLQFQKKDDSSNKEAERRKDWIWGALEKALFAILGALLFLAGLALKKLGILNF